jgi:hypothetical protein
MSLGQPISPDADVRAQMKRWLDNWARTGPILERDRWARLAAMTDAEAQQVTADVLGLWQPDWHGDDGEGLLLQQKIFRRSRPAPRVP